MKSPKKRALLAALGLVLGGAGALAAFREERPMSPLSAPVGEAPAIDREVPAKLETATFALG
jgi:hypothetical protein